MVAASANTLNQVCISYFLTCQINIHCINMHANLWFFMILHQILVFLNVSSFPHITPYLDLSYMDNPA